MTISGESLTFVLASVHLPVNFNQDTCITQAHDKQREHVQCDKVEHVICRLLPVLLKTSMSSTLDKVNSLGLNCPENKQLSYRDTNEELLVNRPK